MTEVKIKSDFIKLDSALKFSNAVSSGGEAKILIKQGNIKVNGEVCLMRGKKLKDGDTFSFNENDYVIKYEG